MAALMPVPYSLHASQLLFLMLGAFKSQVSFSGIHWHTAQEQAWKASNAIALNRCLGPRTSLRRITLKWHFHRKVEILRRREQFLPNLANDTCRRANLPCVLCWTRQNKQCAQRALIASFIPPFSQGKG